MSKFYAVRIGRNPGIYNTWEECRKEVSGFSGAEYKRFSAMKDAEEFMNKTKKDVLTASEATAYVDGSYSAELNMFSYGAVIFHNDKELHFKKAFSLHGLESMHNVAGEIKGAEFVMQYCADNGIKSVDIYYDYSGIEKWCTGEWKATKQGTQQYARFYSEISTQLKVNFFKVKGHSGNVFNELADKLAKSALNINK